MKSNTSKTIARRGKADMAKSTSKHVNASSIDAENLPEIQWQGVRVVTTETLAWGYGTKETNIRTNLDANRGRFVEGVHIVSVSGRELADLRVSNPDAQISNKTRSLTLWTAQGAARMSKIVDTDESWSFFEKMEQAYFHKSSSTHPASNMPNFSDPAAAARAWADEYEAKNKMIGYAHRQSQYINHLENLIAGGITPYEFCKQFNGVNVRQVNAFLEGHNWLFDDRPESKKPRWRVGHYARDNYLTERPGKHEQDDGSFIDTFKPILLHKGGVWLYRKYLKGCLPMKKGWDGEFTHVKGWAVAA